MTAVQQKGGRPRYESDGEDEDSPLNLVNKKILEIKKKIQLSEGQRKAHFEEADVTKRAIKNKVTRLKRKIVELKARIKATRRGGAEDVFASKCPVGKCDIPVKDKTCEEALQAADLKETELRKRLDLLRDLRRRRRKEMAALARRFREAVALSHAGNGIPEPPASAGAGGGEKNDKLKQASLENRAERARVLRFESEHVRREYRRMRLALQQDRASHDVRLQQAKEQWQEMSKEIEKLQNAYTQAARLRDKTRALLHAREQGAARAASARSKKTEELRGQVQQRKLQLERLERTIFPAERNATGMPCKNNY
ncbi:uncharacterized protein LOC113388501 [Ctenocephalides felis]|uniref:uncharacterized protein LOC113388501 n=1 Tax=Ctenocephalides felis TaxID=7515 RepID=UPI000E6E1787|nr:uncharacterized protein LOC113388501 [Ctenocephalides felis]